MRGARRRLRSHRRILRIALPTAAALVAGAAVAAASIPGNNGTITACYANKTDEKGSPVPVVVGNVTEAPGTLRVIDPSEPTLPGAAPNPAGSCVPGESTITWNQAGPQGPPGQPGSPGANGIQGAQGAQGAPLIGETTLGISARDAQMFLKLDGIKGESLDDGHKDEIEIHSFALGANGDSSRRSGKVAISTIHITKKIDKSSPTLFKAAATGKHIPEAQLSFTHRIGGKDVTYLRFDFQNVQIATVQDGASADEKPTESLSLNFGKVEMTYYDAKGKPGPGVSVNVGSTLKP